MVPGSRGLLTRSLAGALAALALVPPLAPGPPRVSPWWEVRCAMTVRGDYSITDLDTTFIGDFQLKARWEGTMERDGPDFRLFHGKAEVQTWEMREKTVPAGGAGVLTEKDIPERPALRLNYVIRHGPDILICLAVDGPLIPLASSPEKFDLVLPRTRVPGAETTGYEDFITKGANAVVLTEEGLAEKSLERSFTWDWKRRQWTARGRGAVKLAEMHKVTVVVTLVRHD